MAPDIIRSVSGVRAGAIRYYCRCNFPVHTNDVMFRRSP